MSNCMEEYKWYIVGGSMSLFISLVTNVVMAFRIFSDEKNTNKKIKQIEMVPFKNQEERENVIIKIGSAREKIQTCSDLPPWVVEEYNSSRVPTVISP